MSRVAVLDYDSGNLLSVCRALEHCGARVELVERPERVADASRLVLPGVGAFADCMTALRQRGFDEALRAFAATGRPVLGICVGMQMLFDSSDEFGRSAGIGLLPGVIRRIPSTDGTGSVRKVPHIGWSDLVPDRDWQGTLLESIAPNAAVYFVHSYAAQPEFRSHILAHCVYAGLSIPACVNRENISGCQFHPEKSGPNGLKILRGFLELADAGPAR